MSYEFHLNELRELRARLQRCKFVVNADPNDCASAEANIRHFLSEDLNELYNRVSANYGNRLSDKERDILRESVNTLQSERRELMQTLNDQRQQRRALQNWS